MAHFRSGQSLVIGLALVTLISSCGGTDSPTTTRTISGINVRVDGIGAADIGHPPASVFAELNSFFGEPDVDSGWIASDSPLYGTCPGVAMRAAGWGSLYAFFVSDDGAITEDNQELVGRLFSFSYGYDFSRNEGATDPRNLNLETDAGARLGSTRSQLRTLYGNTLLEEYNEAADTWTWSAQLDAGELRGLFSGPEDEATVVLIETSPGCEIG